MADISNNPHQHWLHWLQFFDNRQAKLIHNCQVYAQHPDSMPAQHPGSMPAHQLALIIAKMAQLLHQYTKANETQDQITQDHNKFLQEIQDKD